MSIYDKSSLVLIPSGTKTSKVYSQKPTNGDGDFDFTRSTAATRVNADGNIEKETSNLMLQSNAFNNWSGDPTLTSGQTGYDGSSDAWLLDTTSIDTFIYRNDVTSFSGVTTTSVYAKKGTADGIRLRFNQSSDANIYINLINGSDIGAASGTISHNVTNLGSGWYRIEMSFIASGSQDFRIYVTDVTGASTVGTVYIQDSQANQGLVAQPYQETTTTALYGGITDNVPRLDYTDSSCPALLLEPQRTNLVVNSEYFGGTDWTKGNSSITTNATTSPSGFVDGSFLVPNTSASTHTCGKFVGITSGTYTLSVYAKQGGYKNLLVWFDGHSGGVGVNLDDLSVFRDQNNDGYTIEDFGNGWVRIAVTITASSTASPNFYVYSNAATPAISYAGDGTSGLYLYGAQAELGSYATSYIPTYGAGSVTRNGDRYETKSLNNFVDTANGFSFYYEIRDFELTEVSFADYFSIRVSDAVSTNIRSEIRTNGTAGIFSSGITGFTTLNINDWYSAGDSIKKMCLVMTNNSQKVFVNGVLKASSTNTLTLPTFQQLNSDLNAGQTAQMKFAVNQTMLFQSALTDQEAIDLTTI